MVEATITLVAVAAGIYLLSKLMFFDLTKGPWKRSKQELPAVAERLGLKAKMARVDQQIGQVSGKLQGRAVSVRPDERATIELAMKGWPDLSLSTVSGTTKYKTGVAGFDAFFRTRKGVSESAARYQGADLTYVNEFRGRWNRVLEWLEVSDGQMRCSLRYGRQTYIPAPVLERLLPDMCQLAQVLEAPFQEQ